MRTSRALPILILACVARAGGAAPQLPSHGVQLMGQVTPDSFAPPLVSWGAKCWGHTSPSGRRYAVAGTTYGTAFVEVSDPGRPCVVGFVEGPYSGWRTIRVYREHAYVVSEGGDGIQVIDLREIDAGQVCLVTTALADGRDESHNVALDTTSGFLYRLGGDHPGRIPIRIYDLADPQRPLFVGAWVEEAVHDAQVVTYGSGPFAGRQVAFACTDTAPDSLSIIDVTDKSRPVRLAELSYPNAAGSHQVWLSDDRRFAFLNDELDEIAGLPSTVYVFDVADIERPSYLTSFTNGNSAITHDGFVKDGLLYCANYTSGLRIFDVRDPLNVSEVAWFDTWPHDDEPTFDGLISTYPFLGDGIVLGDDDRGGLFVWFVGEPRLEFEYPRGLPAWLDPEGDVIAVRILERLRGDFQPGTATLHFDAGSGAESVPLVHVGGSDYEATLPPMPCGTRVEMYVSARSANGFTWTDPPASTTRFERHRATVARGRVVALSDDFDDDTGWTTYAPPWAAVRQIPRSGFWERVEPNGTASAPEHDHTPGAGGLCWVTDDGPPGAGHAEHEVVGGPYVLTSPVLDLSGLAEAHIRYARWFSNNGTDEQDDVLLVEITANGAEWVPVETVGPTGPGNTGGWWAHQFRVAELVPPSATVQVRFLVRDDPNNSIVEAALDDFEVFELICD